MDATVYPITLTFSTTPAGTHKATAQYPLAMAMHARHLPAFAHEGRTYVPYTGTVVTPERVTRHGRPVGFYMEYRPLHTHSQ